MVNISQYLLDDQIFLILNKYGAGPKLRHIQNVEHYSDIIIKLINGNGNFDDGHRTMLKYASLLHDIGCFINKDRHDKHSKYIILKDRFFDSIPFNERNILAMIVASHRSRLDKEIAFYPRREQKKIIELASILRLADALDYNNEFVVSDAIVKERNIKFTVKHPPKGKALKKIQEKSCLFTETFNLNIEVLL